MDVFQLRSDLIDDYSTYIHSFIRIRDGRIRDFVNRQLDSGPLWPDALIQMNPAFEPGDWIDALKHSGIHHSECKRIFRAHKKGRGERRRARLHLKAAVHVTEDGLRADLGEPTIATQDAGGGLTQIKARFSLPVSPGELYLSRTHPVVEGLANFFLDSPPDPISGDAFSVRPSRCGVTRTSAVTTRTTLLLLRLRCHIVTRRDKEEATLLAEDLVMVAFQGAPASAVWLPESEAEALLSAVPTGSVGADQASIFLQRVVEGYDTLVPHLESVIRERAEAILSAHRRVRTASKLTGVQYQVEPQLQSDALAIYVFLPGGAA